MSQSNCVYVYLNSSVCVCVCVCVCVRVCVCVCVCAYLDKHQCIYMVLHCPVEDNIPNKPMLGNLVL